MTTLPIDPKQALTLNYYQDPRSATFGNLKQSALRAGYAPAYAHTLSSSAPVWLTSNIKSTVSLIGKAERNLAKYISLQIDTKDRDKGNIDFAKMQLDASKFVLKNLARGKYSMDGDDNGKPDVKIIINKIVSDQKIIDVEDLAQGTSHLATQHETSINAPSATHQAPSTSQLADAPSATRDAQSDAPLI